MHVLHFFVDETGLDARSRFAAVACIIVDDAERIRQEIDALRESLVHDPFLDDRTVRTLRRKGFHFTDDAAEVRSKFIDLLMTLTFEAYVCFVEKPTPFDPRAWLDRLLGRLIFERLRANRSHAVHLCIEQTDSKKQRRLTEVREVVARCAARVRRERGGLPIAPAVRCTGKDEPCLAVADYACGIVREYLEARDDRTKTYPRRNLARLRPKLRVIHDYATDKFYTRKHPLP
ncbi:MAG: hypothetical protein E6J57_01665 [Deltaproteobacteria bacterium]|nr:MAG: hypothetical protein E6J57_01665 [Deltaproteobacteria bacterium]